MLWRYERMAAAMGYEVVAGVDEVGMGPLAGPVVGGAVVLPVGVRISGLDDSKLLTVDERERLDVIIRRKAVAVSVCAVDHLQVCTLGLTRARHLATAGAVAGLKLPAAGARSTSSAGGVTNWSSSRSRRAPAMRSGRRWRRSAHASGRP